MIEIFSYFLGDSLEVFIDDFSILWDDFDSCLAHMTKILEVYVKKWPNIKKERERERERET